MNFNKKGMHSSKFVAVSISIFLLMVLVIAGPTNKVSTTLGLESNSNTVESGGKIEFIANVDIEESVSPKELSFIITGEDFEKICTFDVDGKMKSGANSACHGINIKKMNKNEYGYGYRNNFFWVYEITLHTQKIPTGKFSSRLEVDGEVTEDFEFEVFEKQKGN